MALRLEPLTAAAFSPYGEVITLPQAAGRDFFDKALKNDRPDAWPSLSVARVETAASLPLTTNLMERHQYSSQSFVPLGFVPWIVVVAPHDAGGKPDMGRAKAFSVGPGQGVTFGANVWHHPMTVLAAPAEFAIVMWMNGSADDTELITLSEPVVIAAA